MITLIHWHAILQKRFISRPLNSKNLSTRLILVKQRWLWIRRRFFACKSRQQRRAGLRTAIARARLWLWTWTLTLFLAMWKLGMLVNRDTRQIGFVLGGCTVAQESMLVLIRHIATKHRYSPPAGIDNHHRCSRIAARGVINIFVLGINGTTSLAISPHATIGELLARLRLRHPHTSRINHYVTFPAHGLHPLDNEKTLCEIGAQHNSTLHIRARILGGARGLGQPDPVATKTRFTQQRGQFNSTFPERWEPLPMGSFRCLVCNTPVHGRYVHDHETTNRVHERRLPEFLERMERTAAANATTERVERADTVRIPLASLLKGMQQPSPSTPAGSQPGDINWQANVLSSYAHGPSWQSQVLSNLAESFVDVLNGGMAVDSDTVNGDGDTRGEEAAQSPQIDPAIDESNGTARQRGATDFGKHSEWYPWPDRETCILDIIRHVPRCAFSEKQNSVIHWALLMMGVRDVPSESTLKDVDEMLQRLCGVQTIRYSGGLGHIYYANDFAAIVAQEFANPLIRPHLRTLPEDSGTRLSEAWQAQRWLKELRPELTTQSIRMAGQVFFLFEPTLLRDGRVCVPVRWFLRHNKMHAKIWPMCPLERGGWVVNADNEEEIEAATMVLAFPELKDAYRFHEIDDPREIRGLRQNGSFKPWSYTDPQVGNRWRKKADGHPVLAFPIWLYCDDTSGNVSKKWNKHNSFLFTAAGLPRRIVHREFNVHFLSTSNVAPPLEMLDGIADQLQACQQDGIWVWDAELREMALVIPSVLAMLGDNPMQSELSCHIGLTGRMFCRVCSVWGKGDETTEGGDEQQHVGQETDDVVSERGDSDVENDSEYGSDKEGFQSGAGGKRRKKKVETMTEKVQRITRFMKCNQLRTRAETREQLRSQFAEARRVGGMTSVKRLRTLSGIKDTFQSHFIEKLFCVARKKGLSKEQKQERLDALAASFPDELHRTSPVWRINDLDPHSDTPVETLHVTLLGHVKYFWRDAMARLTDNEKELVIARLNSFDVSGLGISPLSGTTLVQYAGSLTGRDFRALAQAAPFVLYGLSSLSDAHLDVWTSLSRLIPLIWTPEIDNVSAYLVDLQKAIDHFLDRTCKLTPRWFNKPKFHIIIHLPDHIRRFGPAMLFATEGFESFNAIIRSHSVHSNRQAPSRDIAEAMARHNRLRHLVSGGYFLPSRPLRSRQSSGRRIVHQGISPWLQIYAKPTSPGESWVAIGDAPRRLLQEGQFGEQFLGLSDLEELRNSKNDTGICVGFSPYVDWTKMKSSSHLACPQIRLPMPLFRSAEKILLPSHEVLHPGNWVIWRERNCSRRCVGQVVEIVQMKGSPAESRGAPDMIVVSPANIGSVHERYDMPQLTVLDEHIAIQAEDILCGVNVQHNCLDHHCQTTSTRIIYYEREKSDSRGLEVTHHKSRDYILNTGQMRDGVHLQHFRPPIPSLDRSQIILAAVKAEVDADKKQSSSRSKPKMPQRTAQQPPRAKSVIPSGEHPPSTRQDSLPPPRHPMQYLPAHHSTIPIATQWRADTSGSEQRVHNMSYPEPQASAYNMGHFNPHHSPHLAHAARFQPAFTSIAERPQKDFGPHMFASTSHHQFSPS